MIESDVVRDEIASHTGGERPHPQPIETAPPPLSETNARIEALAAEIRAAREPAATPQASGRLAEAAGAATPVPEPAPAAARETARIEPRRLGLIPFIAAEPRAETSEPPAQKSWAPESLLRIGAGKRLRIGAIAASLAAIGLIATAALRERSSQAQILAAQSAENQSLAATLKMLKTKVDALEAAKSRDDTAELRKAVGDMKASLAGARDSGAGLAQLAARVDKAQRDQDARLAKLSEKLDHDSASRNTDVVARLEKLEKKPAAPALAALPPPVVPAPGPTTLPKQAALLPTPAPALSKETTGSIARPRPTLHDWVVRDVHDGIAVVEGRDGEREVSPGDILPGAGRVERIERRGRDWAVVTNLGTIVGDSAAQF